MIIPRTHKSDNTRCHATPKTTWVVVVVVAAAAAAAAVVVVVVVAVVAAAAIPYRIIPLSLPTSTQNLSSITVKIFNMPDQTKITHTGRGSERRGGEDRIDLFPKRGSLTSEFLPSSGQAILLTPPLKLLVLYTTCRNTKQHFTLPQILHWRVSYDSHN